MGSEGIQELRMCATALHLLEESASLLTMFWRAACQAPLLCCGQVVRSQHPLPVLAPKLAFDLSACRAWRSGAEWAVGTKGTWGMCPWRETSPLWWAICAGLKHLSPASPPDMSQTGEEKNIEEAETWESCNPQMFHPFNFQFSWAVLWGHLKHQDLLFLSQAQFNTSRSA